MQESIEKIAAGRYRRLKEQQTAAGTQYPHRFLEKMPREFDVVHDIHHDQVVETGIRERKSLSVGGGIEPALRCYVGRDNVTKASLQAANTRSYLQCPTGTAPRGNPSMKILIDHP